MNSINHGYKLLWNRNLKHIFTIWQILACTKQVSREQQLTIFGNAALNLIPVYMLILQAITRINFGCEVVSVTIWRTLRIGFWCPLTLADPKSSLSS